MKPIPFIDFNAKCVGVDPEGSSFWVNPDGTVQILNSNDALEFMAIKRQILQAKRFLFESLMGKECYSFPIIYMLQLFFLVIREEGIPTCACWYPITICGKEYSVKPFHDQETWL